MKTIYSFIVLSAIVLFHSGCVKGKGDQYTIAGRILLGCTSTPFANREVYFFQGISSNGVSTSGGDLGKTTTDANGYFSFKYITKNDEDIKIQSAPGSPIIQGVPGDQNLNDIRVYTRPSTTIQVKLNVLKTYSSQDTLYITDFRNNNLLAIPGPFTSKILYYAKDYPILNYSYRPSNYKITLVHKIG
ncbi:MAG TPA: hypothetical protein VMR70_01385, partial [Flavisolibacter sp.]|nr:hypothetical protein [Flavisolibacter sp.]